MFKPALRLVVRLLPLTAALMASVAIGASTQGAEAPRANGIESPGLAQELVSTAARPLRQNGTMLTGAVTDSPLLAQADIAELAATAYPVGVLDTALTTPPRAVARSEVRHGFELPRPDRWTSLLATLALGAFFFLRRIV